MTIPAAATHMIVLPGGGYAEHAPYEAEPVASWLGAIGVQASVFRYPLNVRHPVPLDALRAEIGRRLGRRCAAHRAHRVLRGRSSGRAGRPRARRRARPDGAVRRPRLRHHLDGDRNLPSGPADPPGRGRQLAAAPVDIAGCAGHAASPPFFVWHTAEDPYVPPEHTYRLASALAACHVPHAVHMFTHGPHGLGLAQDAGEAAIWTTLAKAWIHEQACTAEMIHSASWRRYAA